MPTSADLAALASQRRGLAGVVCKADGSWPARALGGGGGPLGAYEGPGPPSLQPRRRPCGVVQGTSHCRVGVRCPA
eukprot:10642259-Alexandrium_andersonii.AAC.1